MTQKYAKIRRVRHTQGSRHFGSEIFCPIASDGEGCLVFLRKKVGGDVMRPYLDSIVSQLIKLLRTAEVANSTRERERGSNFFDMKTTIKSKRI